MMNNYLKNPKKAEYNKHEQFIFNPYPRFSDYVDGLKSSVIDAEIRDNFFANYQNSMESNLKALDQRL